MNAYYTYLKLSILLYYYLPVNVYQNDTKNDYPRIYKALHYIYLLIRKEINPIILAPQYPPHNPLITKPPFA